MNIIIKSKILVFFIFFSSYNYLFSQNFDKTAEDLAEKMKILQSSENDSEKIKKNDDFKKIFYKTLSEKGSFSYDFGKRIKISELLSSDKRMKIYTWNLQFSDGNFKYFGFVQYKIKKKKILLFELNDKSESIKNPEHQNLNPENWYGALYYEIIAKKYKKQRCYILLGWDGNNDLTNKKIIDIFYVDKSGFAFFGKAVFENSSKKNQNRMIFEYTEQVNMLLHYDDDYKMIIWEHLSPSNPDLKGQFQYYGPDFSYDGLFYKKGQWYFYPNIKPKNKKTKKNNKNLKYGY